MAVRVTPFGSAPSYDPPLHVDVDAHRLQGMEAGPTDAFWVGHSVYEPGGCAQTSPAAQETVYVVGDGELVLSAEGAEHVLHAGDSVHLAKGTVRSVENRSAGPATLIVIIATPGEPA